MAFSDFNAAAKRKPPPKTLASRPRPPTSASEHAKLSTGASANSASSPSSKSRPTADVGDFGRKLPAPAKPEPLEVPRGPFAKLFQDPRGPQRRVSLEKQKRAQQRGDSTPVDLDAVEGQLRGEMSSDARGLPLESLVFRFPGGIQGAVDSETLGKMKVQQNATMREWLEEAMPEILSSHRVKPEVLGERLDYASESAGWGSLDPYDVLTMHYSAAISEGGAGTAARLKRSTDPLGARMRGLERLIRLEQLAGTESGGPTEDLLGARLKDPCQALFNAGAGTGSASVGNVARVIPFSFERQFGRQPTPEEALSIFENSHTLTSRLAGADLLPFAVVRDAAAEDPMSPDGAFDPTKFEIVTEHGKQRLDFTPSLRDQVMEESGVWLDTTLGTRTGCPAQGEPIRQLTASMTTFVERIYRQRLGGGTRWGSLPAGLGEVD